MPRWSSHRQPGTQAYSACACLLWQARMSNRRKLAGGVNRHIASYTSPNSWSRSVCWCLAGGWLAEIVADLREAVAHLRRDAIQIHRLGPYLTLLSFTAFTNRCSLYVSGSECAIMLSWSVLAYQITGSLLICLISPFRFDEIASAALLSIVWNRIQSFIRELVWTSDRERSFGWTRCSCYFKNANFNYFKI